MRRLSIPDRTRLIANVEATGAKPREGIDPYGIIKAWRTDVDAYDIASQPVGLCLQGEALDGTHTKQIFVPEGVVLQGIRERFAAIRVASLLFRGKTNNETN